MSDGLIEIQDGHAYDKPILAADVIVRAKVQKLSGQNVMLTLRKDVEVMVLDKPAP